MSISMPLVVNPLTTNLFLERIEELMYLDGQSARFGLAFAVFRSLFPQLHEIVAANGVRQRYVGHEFAQRTVFHQYFQVHLGLATQPGHASRPKARRLARTACRRASSLSKIVPKRNGRTVPLRKHTLTTCACSKTVFSSSFPFPLFAVVFADNHRELPAGITQDWRAIYTLNPFQQERTAGAGSI